MSVNPLVFPGFRSGFTLLIGAFVAAIGLYFALMPPGPNAWGGARVRWTFADKEIWYAAQVLTGWLLVVGGLSMLIWLPLGLAVTLVGALSPVVYARARYIAKYGTSRTWYGGEGLIDYRPVAKCPDCGHLNQLQRAEDLSMARCEACRHPLSRA